VFVVPRRFNQNAGDVQAIGPAAETGKMLLEHLAERLRLRSLESLDILDFGCGSRFADAIANLNIPLRSYIGVDTNKEMIDYLTEHVPDKRLSFFYFNSFNYAYNRNGALLTTGSSLPIGAQTFDVICMFSVLTHQVPEDSLYILKMLRKYVRRSGSLFFTAKIRADIEYYHEEIPDRPCMFSAYSLELLAKLIRLSNWCIKTMEPSSPQGLPMDDSFLCAPL